MHTAKGAGEITYRMLRIGIWPVLGNPGATARILNPGRIRHNFPPQSHPLLVSPLPARHGPAGFPSHVGLLAFRRTPTYQLVTNRLTNTPRAAECLGPNGSDWKQPHSPQLLVLLLAHNGRARGK